MSLNPSPFVTRAKVIYMMSFSRSGETLMQRHLNAHPDIQVGYALTDKEPKGLDRLLREARLKELSTIQCARFGIRKKNVLGKSIWVHGDQPGFVLSRHPFSVVASIVSNFNRILWDRQQLPAVKVKKINRLCSYVDPRIADGLEDSLSMDDVVLKVALAWSKRMSVAHASGDPVVRYEDFVANPREELEKLCAALDLPFHEDMIHA